MTESQLSRICQQLTAVWPPDRCSGFPTLVAVSGGADSVALLRLLVHLAEGGSFTNQKFAKGKLIVAHVNHRQRGDDSDGDEQFVRELAQQLGIEVCVAHFDGNTSDPSEDCLRQFRYDALIRLANQFGARYLATGHTRDDQIETILFRIFRGTGLPGLSGIPRLRVVDEAVSIVRPLLDVSRVDIETLLRELDQTYRHDLSNEATKYTRNFLRNELLPVIETRFGDSVGDALLRLSLQASEALDFVDSHANFENAIMARQSDSFELDCNVLADQPSLLVRQFLMMLWQEQGWSQQSMSHEWWIKLADAISEPTENLVLNLPGNIRMVKNLMDVKFYAN
jgi:tRNA(Ile)-lysidine synthase